MQGSGDLPAAEVTDGGGSPYVRRESGAGMGDDIADLDDLFNRDAAFFGGIFWSVFGVFLLQ